MTRFVVPRLFALLMCVGLSNGGWAADDTYPNQPIRIVVAFAAGAAVDIVSRIVAEQVSKEMGATVVVENRPGASGNIATEAVAKAAPDGYTILSNGLPLATNPGIFTKLPYNPIDDFVPVSLLVIQPNVLVVNGALPFKTVGELVQYAKAHPGKLNFASSGIGTSQHLAGEMFRRLAGVDIVHVPYRSGAAALVDLIGGQIQMMFDPLTSAVPYIQAGQLRGLAVTTLQRSPALPDLPSLSEAGVANFESRGWVGLLAPAGTPPKIVDKLNNAVVRSLQDAAVKERLGKLGLNVVGNTSAEFAAFLRAEIDSWTAFTKELKIKLD